MIAYTIVSRAYVPYARVLARTYALHHGGEKLWALLIDDVSGSIVDAEEPFNVLRPGDIKGLPQDEVNRMAMLFGGKVIATIKPWVFEHFLAQGAESVLYIDSDFVIFDSLAGMSHPGEDGVILVPHVLSPLPRDGLDPDETTLLGSGMYNAGMFGVGPRHGGFLEFLMERLRRECIFDAKKMRFNEQRWLDFVPSVFPHRIVRDPGVDVAYWNLHERPLTQQGEKWFAGGRPLRAIHFSSFEPRAKSAGGRFEWATPTPRIRMSTHPAFAELCGRYRQMLYSDGLTDTQDAPFAFDMLPDGTPVYDSLRELFRTCVLAADGGLGVYPPDPFSSSDADAFREWAEEQYASSGLSLPRRLSTEAMSRMHRARFPMRWTSTKRRPKTDQVQTSKADADSKSTWAIDLLDRMALGEAGRKGPTGIDIVPERSGFICHGPRASLVPGPYRITLEFEAGARGEGAEALDQLLVVEAFVQGYVVGSCSATVADVSTGILVFDIDIPGHLWDASLLLGLELRVLTRGRLRASLTAIILETGVPDGNVRGSESSHSDWLPMMAGGSAGRRVGAEIVTASGMTGTVVMGPNWRLLPGGYRVTVGTRLTSDVRQGAGQGLASVPVALLEVVVGDKILAERPVEEIELARGGVQCDFVVGEDDAHPGAQVGVRFGSVSPIDAVVTAVVVDRCLEPSPVDESVA